MEEKPPVEAKPPLLDLYDLQKPQPDMPVAEPIKQLIIASVQDAAENNPRAVLDNFSKWGPLMSSEEISAVFKTAAKTAVKTDPELLHDDPLWMSWMNPRESSPIMAEAVRKIAVKHPEKAYEDRFFFFAMESYLTKEEFGAALYNANLSMAGSKPFDVLSEFDRWKDSVSEEQKKEILTQAIKTSYATQEDPLIAAHHVHYAVRRCETKDERDRTAAMIADIKQELGITGKPGAESPAVAEKPGQSKPALVMIYGDNLDSPTYDDVVREKIACEKAGQTFLLIPAPKENEQGEYVQVNGHYVPSVRLDDLSNRHIDDAIYEAFRPGGELAGQEFTGYINTHGKVKVDSHSLAYRRHSNARTQVQSGIDSTIVFDSLMQQQDASGNNLCTGVFMGSCHGGASVSDMDQSLRNYPITRPVHLFADAPFEDVSWQDDSKKFLTNLSTLAENGTAFTIENLKSLYLEHAQNTSRVYKDRYHNTPNVVERHFSPGDLPTGRRTTYENLTEKLQYIIDNKEDFVAHFKDDPETLKMLERLKQKTSVHDLKASGLYPMSYTQLMLFADKTYDTYATAKNMPRDNAFVSPDLLRVYSGNYAHLTRIPTEERTAVLTELSQEEAAVAVLKDYGQWKDYIGADDREKILDQAAKTYTRLDERTRKDQMAALEKDLTPEDKALLLKHFSQHSGEIFTSMAERWKDSVSAADLQPHYDAITQNLMRQNPMLVLKNTDFLYNHFPQGQPKEKFTVLIDDATQKAVKDEPIALLSMSHGRDMIGTHLGIKKSHEYTQQAVTQAAKDNPGYLLVYYEKWADLYDKEESKKLVKSAVERMKEKGSDRAEMNQVLYLMRQHARDPQRAAEGIKAVKEAANELGFQVSAASKPKPSQDTPDMGDMLAMAIQNISSEEVLGNLRRQTPGGITNTSQNSIV